MLMRYYLEDEFKLEYPGKVAAIRSEEYYVNMAQGLVFRNSAGRSSMKQVLPLSGRDSGWIRMDAQ